MHPNTRMQEELPSHAKGWGAMTATCLPWDFLQSFSTVKLFFPSICWIYFHCLPCSSSADPSLARLGAWLNINAVLCWNECCSLNWWSLENTETSVAVFLGINADYQFIPGRITPKCGTIRFRPNDELGHHVHQNPCLDAYVQIFCP